MEREAYVARREALWVREGDMVQARGFGAVSNVCS